MDVIAEIRRRHFIEKESITSLAEAYKLSRPTIRKHLKTVEVPVYHRNDQPHPKLGSYRERLDTWLEQEAPLPRKQRRSAQRLYECLQVEGYRGGYTAVQRYVKRWKKKRASSPTIKQAFVPLAFPAGETCQFDWSQETVELGGVVQTIKVAHFRLAYSRQMFIVAYPRETQEMVLDAHNQAFAFFGGVPKRMVYDNLKTVVDAIFVGKERRFNRRFLALANHYLFEPVACTPESGWEKGQVENQVGNIREWLFTPRAKFEDFAALNAWLATRCRELAGRLHPEQASRTIADCFAEEQPRLMPVKAVFDGYVEEMRRVSQLCLIRIDRNRYSVPAEWANSVVSVRLTADCVRMVAEGQIIAEHSRQWGRDQLVCDPWHYLPVLEKKPGALRHGAPFRAWDLPVSIKVVRDRILKQDKGDRAFVDLLLMARDLGDGGLDVLEVACDLTLQTGVISAAIVLNEMRRLTEAAQPKTLDETPAPILTLEPVADCSRYDALRSARHVH
ncbi:MAG: IS21 family transposase [Methylicorpusculum sp.]|uniref:IS21 family transposase n=1 Tax=Methylicorpusculum TaxID=2713642 RepID=UPI00135A9A72|nr:MULTISPECIES: IS21 family transposase [Methylicorpusculum]MCD2452038.1 IS21 family transposase [Methylicorpusculum oleiharenae]MDP2203497.1 IS21 family transposase [Methylicorpusculum sp.]